jgi:hypothetical protein
MEFKNWFNLMLCWIGHHKKVGYPFVDSRGRDVFTKAVYIPGVTLDRWEVCIHCKKIFIK